MKKIRLNAVAEAVAESNGGTISTELLEVLKKAHAAGLNAEGDCVFEKIPAEPRCITYGCPLSEEAEAVLLVRGRMGDREAKQVFFAAYEGLVKKRAASFFHHGSGRRLLGDFDEAVSLACEAFYQAMDEADIVKDGRLVRVSNLFGVIVRRYETRERMYNLSVSIPANLYHAANRLDAYLKVNMLCLEDISRETCEDAGCCGSFGWKSVRDACAALRMGSQPFSDLQCEDVPSGGRQAAWVSEKPGRIFFISRRTENSVQLVQAVILKRTRRCMQGSCKQILGLADRYWGNAGVACGFH